MQVSQIVNWYFLEKMPKCLNFKLQEEMSLYHLLKKKQLIKGLSQGQSWSSQGKYLPVKVFSINTSHQAQIMYLLNIILNYLDYHRENM